MHSGIFVRNLHFQNAEYKTQHSRLQREISRQVSVTEALRIDKQDNRYGVDRTKIVN